MGEGSLFFQTKLLNNWITKTWRGLNIDRVSKSTFIKSLNYWITKLLGLWEGSHIEGVSRSIKLTNLLNYWMTLAGLFFFFFFNKSLNNWITKTCKSFHIDEVSRSPYIKDKITELLNYQITRAMEGFSYWMGLEINFTRQNY